MTNTILYIEFTRDSLSQVNTFVSILNSNYIFEFAKLIISLLSSLFIFYLGILYSKKDAIRKDNIRLNSVKIYLSTWLDDIEKDCKHNYFFFAEVATAFKEFLLLKFQFSIKFSETKAEKVFKLDDVELILVDLDSLYIHLSHGDCVGECEEETESRIMAVNNKNDFNFSISPNPSSGDFKAKIVYTGEKPRFIDFKICNSMGIIVNLPNKIVSENGNSMIFEFDSGLFSGIYLVRVFIDDSMKTLKLLIE
jgi:hypothetical protein